jgi:hypothetical protein
MELAITVAMWHGHAGIDKWIGLVWIESKIDQNKIAADVASKLNQRRRPGESVESWHKDTLHLLEQYRRTTSVAYPPAIVDTQLTRLNLSPGSYAADKVLLCRVANVPAESTLLTEVNRAIASVYPLFATYEHSKMANPTFPPRRRTITGGSSSQSPAVRGPSRTLSTDSVRASVHRYVRLVHISDYTTKNASTRRPGFPRRKGRTPSRQARLCWKIGSASPTHVPATIAFFRDILQQTVLPTRSRPPPYESSSSGFPHGTKLFFRSMTLALQCVLGTGRTAWTSAGTTWKFCWYQRRLIVGHGRSSRRSSDKQQAV